MRRSLFLIFPLALLFLGTWSPNQARAQKGTDAAVAKCQSVKGILLARSGVASWKAVKAGDDVAAGALHLALFEAQLRSRNQAVDVLLLGDIGQHGPLPVMETAVTIRQNPKFDLDIAVERGIVVLTNAKKQGAAVVRMELHGEHLDVTLQQPGTKLAFEIYGRHAPGLANVKADNPAAFLVFLVTQGSAQLAYQDKTIALKAPPGQALLKWDSVIRRAEVEFLDKLPEEIMRDEKEKKLFAKMCACAGHLDGKGHLESLLKANDAVERLVGVTALGATDDLPGLFGALSDVKHADAREQAILVLRHWLGRGKGQVKRLTNELMDKRKLSQTQALSLVQLLIGFDATERAQSQTYSLLIDYLKHSHIAVRQLAHWHLVRLAPEGKKIPYDPAAPEPQRQQSHESWLKLIPPGQVPAESRADERDLIGKWVVVGGEQDGATFDFLRDGTMVGRINLKGREGIINARVTVSGSKLHITTQDPTTKRDYTVTQTIVTLTQQDLVVEDEKGQRIRMQRVQ